MAGSSVIYLSGHKSPPVVPLLEAGTIGLLNQPSARYVVADGWVWAADNGCFNARTYVGDEAWIGWLAQQPRDGCLFAVAPDVLGSHDATVERSSPWLPRIRQLGYEAAFVAQDGATPENLPFDSFEWLFVGGSTGFKLGSAPLIAAAIAKGKRVHVGRVNSGRRFAMFSDMGAHSADGTFLAFGPATNIPRMLRWPGLLPQS